MSIRRSSARQSALKRFSASTSVKQVPVKSRMIESIYFSQEDGQLRICLTNGHQRLFKGVTETEAMAIAAAPSPGNYYVTEFKARHKRAA
ncbi:KTSC domain-containing protein [Rhizobium sp. L245/93]|nr:KTSC domain-containing protein [Rhizobium sp. L245/93]